MNLHSIHHPEEYFRFFNFHEQSKNFSEYVNDYQLIGLVSLEQAVTPLVEYVPQVHEMVRLVKEKCRRLKSDLSMDELASIMLYTLEWIPKESSFYYIFNGKLSSNEPNDLIVWYSYIKLFSTSLEKLSRSSRRIFYRAIPLDLHDQYPKNSRLIWHDYVSCSSSLDFFNQQNFDSNPFNHRTIFTIYTEQSIDISEYSFYPLKDTVVLLPNQQYQVISSRILNLGLCMITLKSIARESIPLTVIDEKEHRLYDHLLRKRLKKYEKYSEMSFRRRGLTDGHMDLLVKYAIEKKSCQWLSLENNRITSHGLSILSEGLMRQHSSLQTLHLAQNFLTDFGIESLAKILVNRFNCLSFLNLNCNRIGNAGARSLANALKSNVILLDLWLSHNDIGNEGAEALAEVLIFDNTTLIQLYLNDNALIDDCSVYPFIRVVNSNECLNTLWLQNCGFTSEGKDRLMNTSKARKDFDFDV